jgi:hypothetical protein
LRYNVSAEAVVLVVWMLASEAARAEEPVGSCPELPPMIASAWASFNDAESAQADHVLHEAREVLACQPDVVPTDTLLEMFRLDGLVALSQADREDAVYATIRAVTIDPEGAPPASYGPQLAELTATWQARLSQRSATVRAEGVDAAWVDGRELAGTASMPIVPGEHLVQWRDSEGFHSEAAEFTAEHVIRGIPSAAIADPHDPHDVHDPHDPHPPADGGGRGLLIAGAAVTALGGGTVLYASTAESAFKRAAWDDDVYGNCGRTDGCYALARQDAITASAGRVRAIYLAGYGLIGLGVIGMGVDAFVVSDSAGLPSGLGVRVPW